MKKTGWCLVAILLLGLVLLVISCGGTPVEEQLPAEQQQPVVEKEQPAIEEPATEEPAAEEPDTEGKGAASAPPMPHGLAGQEDCLQCHGEAGFKPFPADHAGRASDICQGCHQPPS
ncbi:MAG: hypothetical protein V3R96_05575 [Dehalococcoidales bacterium]